MELKEALEKLDPANDDHWTDDGAPRLSAVVAVVGREVKRKEITDASPGLTRESARRGPTGNEGEVAPTGAETDGPAGPDVDAEPGADEGRDAKREELTGRRDYIAAAIEKMRAEIVVLNGYIAEASKEHDEVTSKLEAEFPPKRFSENIQEFLASQHAERVRRAAGRVQTVVNKSPLDQSMARRNTRGAQRPQRPSLFSVK